MEKTAIVTGSSSGLGLAITQSLLDQGFTVFGGSRSGTPLDHDNFYDVELDVSSPESVMEFYETVKEFTEDIHLFVNNAGICEMNSVIDMSIDSFEQQLATNTVGPFLMFKYFAPFIIPGETHIISVLSAAAHYGYPNVSGYNASKFGQRGLLESLKKEWKIHQIRFTSLCPGAIDTPLWDKMGMTFGRDKMLTIDEFMSVFNFVLAAPSRIQFPEITFLNKEGFLE